MPNQLYEPSHLLEATSWVHDLHRCVTTRSAALELGITRRAAAALLADLPANEQGGAKYEVHYSRVVRDESAAEQGSCTTCECDLLAFVIGGAFGGFISCFVGILIDRYPRVMSRTKTSTRCSCRKI